jgi:hypothetical protein
VRDVVFGFIAFFFFVGFVGISTSRAILASGENEASCFTRFVGAHGAAGEPQTFLRNSETCPTSSFVGIARRSDTMKMGIELIAEERERQIAKEGWTAEHDDDHDNNELAAAACCYASAYYGQSGSPNGHPPNGWPWAAKWWKPSRSYRRNLVKAGALIAAEIDRIQRLSDEEK